MTVIPEMEIKRLEQCDAGTIVRQLGPDASNEPVLVVRLAETEQFYVVSFQKNLVALREPLDGAKAQVLAYKGKVIWEISQDELATSGQKLIKKSGVFLVTEEGPKLTATVAVRPQGASPREKILINLESYEFKTFSEPSRFAASEYWRAFLPHPLNPKEELLKLGEDRY